MTEPNLYQIKLNVKTLVEAGEPQANIDSYIKSKGVTIDQIKNYNLNTEKGGSYAARAVVGAQQNAFDKMSALQKYYPGAQAIDDNFLFTDPETGNPTLFNPPGLDIGDFAGGLPEISEAVGGTVGAVAGAAGGAAIGAPAGPAGVARGTFAGGVGGAGLGATIGREGMIKVINALSDNGQDSRTALQKAADMGKTALINAGAQAILPGVGSILASGGRAAINAGRAAMGSPSVLQAAARMGVEMPAGAATGKAGTAGLETAIGAFPSANSIISGKYAKGNAQLGEAAKDLAARMGSAGTKEEAGAALKSGAKKATENFEAKQEQLYTKAFDKVGATRPVKLGNVMQLERDVFTAIQKAPKSMEPTVGKSREAILALLQDSFTGTGTKGTISFDALRQVRTNVGRLLKNPQLMTSNGLDDTTMRQLYGAISKDIEAAAGEAGPEALKALKTADRYTRYNLNVNAPALEKVVESGSDEAAFNYAMSAAKDGGTRLRSLRRNMPKAEWDTVSSTVFENLGRANPGAQGATELGEMGAEWSANTFLTNWNKMSPEARKALFAGRHLDQHLDDLLQVSNRFKEAAKQGNFSNTAKAAVPALAALGILGEAGQGDFKGAGWGLAAAVLAPRLAAKMLTNPETVKWLVQGASIPTAKGWQNHMARLSAIAARANDSEEKEALNQYRDILQKAQETKP